MPLPCRILTCTLWLWMAGGPAWAGPHRSEVFSQSTRLYVSTPNVQRLSEHLRSIQFGRLADDQQMGPFIEAWRQRTGDGTARRAAILGRCYIRGFGRRKPGGLRISGAPGSYGRAD